MAKKKSARKSKPVAKKKKPINQSANAGKKVSKAPKKASLSVSVKDYGAAISKKRSSAQRITALQDSPTAVLGNETNLEAALTVLRDASEAIEVRLAALQSIQAASFSVVAFESARAEYTAALREVAKDNDPEMRQRVLGMLARDNDGYAQKLLLDGLKDKDKALVPPEKALQLLSYNAHAGAFKAARELAEKSQDPMVRCEALRLLSADAKSIPLFESRLRDKKENGEVRAVAAIALHALQPDKLQKSARAIVMDKNEDDDLQAMCLTAMTNFGNYATDNEDLVKYVRAMSTSKKSKLVKQSAKQFVSKYGE